MTSQRSISSTEASVEQHRRTDWRPLAACCLAAFLLLAYGTVTTVSATAIGDDLGMDFADVQWTIDAYLLTLAALVMAAGTLGDRLGHRPLFLISLVVFAATSTACATAQSGDWLIGARVLQGAGAATLFSTSLPLLTHQYEGHARSVALAVWSAVAGAGSTAGTIAGGAVIHLFSWRWLFVAAVPISVVAWLLGRPSLPREERHRRVSLDPAGITLVTVAMTATTYAIIAGGEYGWLSMQVTYATVVASVAVLMVPLAERRSRSPMLPASLFATRTFIGVVTCGFTYYFAAFASLPALSWWLLTNTHATTLQVSMILAIQLAAFIPVSLTLGPRLHHVPHPRVLAGGTFLVGLGCLTGTALWQWPSWTSLIAMLVVTGVGAGIVTPVLPAVAVMSAPARPGIATAAANAARQLGLTLGIALCGTLSHGSAAGMVLALTVCGAVGVAGAIATTALLSPPRSRTARHPNGDLFVRRRRGGPA